MTQTTTVQKILKQLDSEFFIDPTFKAALEFNLYLAYGAGFDLGRKQNAHGKPIVQIRDNGDRQPYPDMTAAAKSMGVDKSSISRAINNKKRCVGFRWEYA